MSRKMSMIVACSVALCLGVMGDHVWADGDETLGPPENIDIAGGTGVVTAGVGLKEGQPEDIDIVIPDGVTINQVLL